MKIDYTYSKGLKKITLDELYSGSMNAIAKLDYDLDIIVNTEAPLTLNTLKAVLREKVFEIGKISQKALDIIDDRINKLGFKQTNNLFDIVLWPKDGIFDLDGVRMGNRAIYDIPYQELIPLCVESNLSGEELYRYVLSYFGYEVLTAKAREYLEFVEKKL